jgi:hypothetical protein
MERSAKIVAMWSVQNLRGPARDQANPPSCVAAVYLFHENPELQDFGSPVETLVSSDVWHASARSRASVLRRPEPATRACATTC